MNAVDATQGLTLIEVLVGLAIFVVVVAMSSAIISSLTINGGSREGLGVNQASQEYLETITDIWSDRTQFGQLTATMPKPKTVAGYNWSVTACEVDMAATPVDCKDGQTVTATQATSGALLLSPAGALLMRLTVVYAPTDSGQSFAVSTEIYRR